MNKYSSNCINRGRHKLNGSNNIIVVRHSIII